MAGLFGRKSYDSFFDGVWDSGDWCGACLLFPTGAFLCALCAAVFLLHCADEPEVLGEGDSGEGGLQGIPFFYDRDWYIIPVGSFYGKLCQPKCAEFCN